MILYQKSRFFFYIYPVNWYCECEYELYWYICGICLSPFSLLIILFYSPAVVTSLPFLACEGHEKLGNAMSVSQVRHVRLPGLGFASAGGGVEHPGHYMLPGVRPALHKREQSSQLAISQP
jgi:hypothetical protein